jgi:hypothetical protein
LIPAFGRELLMRQSDKVSAVSFPKSAIQFFAPEQDQIHLLSPPFSTVATRMALGDKFWSRLDALEQISSELCVDIADFGMGSDSPILLDYRPDVSDPAVIRFILNPVLGETLASGRKRVVGWANVWLRCADTFDAFADMLGLERGGVSSQQ